MKKDRAEQLAAISRALNRADYQDDRGQIDLRLAKALELAIFQVDNDLEVTANSSGGKETTVEQLDNRQYPAAAFAPIPLDNLKAVLKAIVEVFAKVRFILPVFPHQPVSKDGSCPPGTLTEICLADRIANTENQSDPLAKANIVPVYSDLTAFEQANLGIARPVPVNGRGLALMALESPGRLLLNDRFLLGRPALTAIGTGGSWLPAWEDQELLEYLRESLHKISAKLLAGQADFDGLQILGVIPQAVGADRLLVAVKQRDPITVQILGAFQTELLADSTVLARTDLLMITPVPWGSRHILGKTSS